MKLLLIVVQNCENVQLCFYVSLRSEVLAQPAPELLNILSSVICWTFLVISTSIVHINLR